MNMVALRGEAGGGGDRRAVRKKGTIEGDKRDWETAGATEERGGS